MRLSLTFGLIGTVLAIGGLATYLIVNDKDPVLLVTVLIAVVPTIAVLFGVNKVQQQTNGTNTALRAESARKDEEIKALLTVATPEQAAQAGEALRARNEYENG